jgi:hypothetical protein
LRGCGEIREEGRGKRKEKREGEVKEGERNETGVRFFSSFLFPLFSFP